MNANTNDDTATPLAAVPTGNRNKKSKTRKFRPKSSTHKKQQQQSKVVAAAAAAVVAVNGLSDGILKSSGEEKQIELSQQQEDEEEEKNETYPDAPKDVSVDNDVDADADVDVNELSGVIGEDENYLKHNEKVNNEVSKSVKSSRRTGKTGLSSALKKTTSSNSAIRAGASRASRSSSNRSMIVAGRSMGNANSELAVVNAQSNDQSEDGASVGINGLAIMDKTQLLNTSDNNHQTSASSPTATARNDAIVIPPALPGAKTMKDFCSKFKDPKLKRVRKRKGKKDNKDKNNSEDGDIEENNDNDGNESKDGATNTTILGSTTNGFNNKASEVPDTSGPIVELVDGEIVIRESSLQVGGNDKSNADEEYEEVHEGAGEMTATYSSFTNKTVSKRWSVTETKLFYDSLRQVGPDFSTMSAYFPNRNRRQLRNKYKSENKKNPTLVQKALAKEQQKPIGESKVGISLIFVCFIPKFNIDDHAQ